MRILAIKLDRISPRQASERVARTTSPSMLQDKDSAEAKESDVKETCARYVVVLSKPLCVYYNSLTSLSSVVREDLPLFSSRFSFLPAAFTLSCTFLRFNTSPLLPPHPRSQARPSSAKGGRSYVCWTPHKTPDGDSGNMFGSGSFWATGRVDASLEPTRS
jgi:hypothetical protein